MAVGFLAVGAAMMGCVPQGSDDRDPPRVGLANPAAVLCVESGGTFVIRRTAEGSESGVCILADGTEVDAWAFFREKAARE